MKLYSMMIYDHSIVITCTAAFIVRHETSFKEEKGSKFMSVDRDTASYLV